MISIDKKNMSTINFYRSAWEARILIGVYGLSTYDYGRTDDGATSTKRRAVS